MDFRETNNFEQNVCHGCLSFGRRCSVDSENASLFYQLLDPIIIMKEPISLILCWECVANLKKIRKFQFRVNKAQAYLQDVLTNKIEHKSLSTLTTTTKNVYDQTVNDEIPDILPSSLNEHTVCKVILKKIDTSYKVQKVPTKKNNFNVPNEDIIINNYNYTYEIEGVEIQDRQSEINKRDEKYNIGKDEKITLEHFDNDLVKLEELKDEMKMPEQVKESKLEIKQELDDYFSDGNYPSEDHITLDVTAKEIQSEVLLKDNTRKNYKKFIVQRNRARRSAIDFDNADKYFMKYVLPLDAFRAQLKKWASENYFKASKYKCTACALVFDDHDEERIHKELHKNTTKHRCEQCNLSFKSEVELVSHSTAHEIHQCVICLFVCRTPDARDRHLRKSHGRGYWQCDECTLCFRVQKELTAHKYKLHRTFTCDFCNTKRNTKKSILSHINANHMKLKIFQCHLCVRRFRRKAQIRQHLISEHNIGITTASKESMYCVECNKQFSSMNKYSTHLRSSIVHTPKKHKPLVPCPDCGKLFTKKCYRNNHYKLFHGGGTKHRCDPCNKSYATGYGLRLHIIRCHKKIPMPKTKVCDTCGLGFQTNRILIHHMRTHTGERPYECSYCPSRFAQKYARDIHVRNVHLKHMQPYIT